MSKDSFREPADPSEMTNAELQIAQWRVKVTASGIWKIEEIYGEYWDDQQSKKHFGKIFKKAVTTGRLDGIRLYTKNDREELSSDHQIQYVIE